MYVDGKNVGEFKKGTYKMFGALHRNCFLQNNNHLSQKMDNGMKGTQNPEW